jgi:serine protease
MRLLLILAAALSGSAAVHATESVPGRVLVRWRASASAAVAPSTRAATALAAGAWRYVRPLSNDVHLVETTATGAATEQLLATLRADPDVEYAEPDYLRHRTGDPTDSGVTPDDPLFGRQWALPMVRAPQAWSRETGSARTVVAIVDTGIVLHPELKARIIGGYDFITDKNNAGDGDGRDPDYTDPGDATEESSGLHGTHVSGIVAAQSNNQVGVAGLDWACRLLIVRVLGIDRGTGADSDIADAIRWAAGLHIDNVPDNQNPAQVINLSFGGTGYSKTMQDAIKAAVANGAIVVAAAGNDGADAAKDSPAGLDGVIAVGAVDPSGQIASYSNYGPKVALMAPGGSPLRDPRTGASQGVLSTMRLIGSGDTYAELAGTSQAAPFVSATVSLMKSAFPHLTPAQARDLLQKSASTTAQCRDPDDSMLQGCGAGLLDVDAAVVLAEQAEQAGGFDSRLGNVVVGGCAIAGHGDANGAWVTTLLLAVLVVVRARRRVL